jgi:phosphoglycerate kinase
MKTISDFDFKNKTVLLRADLNLDVHKGKVLEGERVKESAVTINELREKKAKIIVIAHQGRPKDSKFKSLKSHAGFLNKYTEVKFVQDVIGKRARKAIRNLQEGEVILLENIRMEKQEFKPGNNKLVRFFVPLINFYVNDAFSVCHREQTSIVSFPRYVKSCAGRLLEKELIALKGVNVRRALFVLGGAKPEENMLLLRKNKVLACGLFGQLCLIAQGKKLGAQERYLKKEIKNYNKILRELKGKLKDCKVQAPLDFAVRERGRRKELKLKEFPSKYEIFDIGKETQEKYAKEIKKARTIFMKGPAGDCADKKFCKGTVSLLRAIAGKNSVIGGGQLSDAVKTSRINKKKFGHVSLSGGALVSYVAGQKLPGLEVLQDA